MDNNSKQSTIGFILIALIFVGFMIYTNHERAKYEAAVAEQQSLVEAEAALQPADTTSGAATQQSLAAGETAREPERRPADEFISEADSVEEVLIENDVLQVRFSTKGAQMVDVTLKEYTKYAPRESRNELVKLFDPESANFNMSMYLKHDLRNVKVSTSDYNFHLLPIESGEHSKVLTMRLPVGNDASLDFVYTVYDELRPERDYLIDFEVRMNNIAPLMANQASVGIDWTNRSYQNERSFTNENTSTTIAYRQPGERSISDLRMGTGTQNKQISTSVDWISFKQQYFSSAIISQSADFTYADVAYQTAEEGSGYIKDFSLQTAVPYTPQTDSYKFSFYMGPNDYAVLSKVEDIHGEELYMERIIPLGWIISSWISRWIVIPVFDFLSQYISSFGLIILILTIGVKILIFPLTYKSYLSTAKMRVIKPELDAIAAKYPRQEDAMKRQQATMELYKKADINVMGGCLPALIQMPILIAMFRFFPASIQLRGQSFLWSDDLSSYDSVLQLPFNIPYYGDHVSLFALLMAVTLFAFSYMNYQQSPAGNQAQGVVMKIMMVYFMPLMMLFWFNNYSSGLCYYYLLSTLFTIIQTVVIRHFLNDNKIHALVHSNMARRSNGKKSRFQLKYEELMRQQEQMMQQQNNKKR